MTGSMDRLLAPVHRRISLAVGRAVLRAASAGGARVQVEALAGEVLDDREHEQAYGFASHPLAGAKAVTVSVGGARNNSVVIVISDPRHRPNLAAGESAMHDDRQQAVHLKQDGIVVATPLKIEISGEGDVTISSGTLVRLAAPEVQIHADDSLRLDCGGYGETWTPTGRQTWTQGTTTTPMGPPSPPEHQP